MTDSLYLLGAPGVGKSTVLAALMDRIGVRTRPDSEQMWGRLRGHGLYSVATGEERGWYLGKMRDQFPGTDGLSMAVAPDARAWAADLGIVHPDIAPMYVFGEGARLGNVGFLDALGASTRLHVVHLTASEERLTERREERGSTQTPSWMRGAATGARNAFEGITRATHLQEIRTDGLHPEAIADRILRVTEG